MGQIWNTIRILHEIFFAKTDMEFVIFIQNWISIYLSRLLELRVRTFDQFDLKRLTLINLLLNASKPTSMLQLLLLLATLLVPRMLQTILLKRSFLQSINHRLKIPSHLNRLINCINITLFFLGPVHGLSPLSLIRLSLAEPQDHLLQQTASLAERAAVSVATQQHL